MYAHKYPTDAIICNHAYKFENLLAWCGRDSVITPWKMALPWRHNERDGVSNHQPHDCLLNRLFRRKSKKTSKLRVTGLCAQRPSKAENVSIWWRHHGMMDYVGAEIATAVTCTPYPFIDKVTERTAPDNHAVLHADTVNYVTILTVTVGSTYTMLSIPAHTHSITTLSADLHFCVIKDGNQVNIQILMYVLVAVVFYGLILTIALIGQRSKTSPNPT